MTAKSRPDDCRYMAEAITLAQRGLGWVEPNPMVGCVIVRDGRIVGSGWHEKFGGPHAEIQALTAAGEHARGATAYVTLEPCCHHGKTPPCTDALLAAQVARVVVGVIDPHPAVSGQGVDALRAAGIEVESGVMAAEARRLAAPFLKRIATSRPWVIAKWAMTLDGKLAARNRTSQWITSEQARATAHQLRARVDAIVVGRGTVAADNPRLTARPPGARTAHRVVLDSAARLPLQSRLIETIGEAPVIVAAGPTAPAANVATLEEHGAEVLRLKTSDHSEQIDELLLDLARRDFTNVLFEGGAQVLGALMDRRAIDEVHAFIAPKLIGGQTAPGPIGGQGIEAMADATGLEHVLVELLGDDVYVSGRVKRPAST